MVPLTGNEVILDPTIVDALQDGMNAEAAGQLAHPFDSRLAPFAHDIRGAEYLRQRDAVGVRRLLIVRGERRQRGANRKWSDPIRSTRVSAGFERKRVGKSR